MILQRVNVGQGSKNHTSLSSIFHPAELSTCPHLHAKGIGFRKANPTMDNHFPARCVYDREHSPLWTISCLHYSCLLPLHLFILFSHFVFPIHSSALSFLRVRLEGEEVWGENFFISLVQMISVIGALWM